MLKQIVGTDEFSIVLWRESSSLDTIPYLCFPKRESSDHSTPRSISLNAIRSGVAVLCYGFEWILAVNITARLCG